MIRIASKKEGFRRCGVEHPAAAKDYPDDRFSKKELEILKAEPMLVVVEGLPDPEGKTNAPDRPNVAESVKRVKATASLEELEELAKGEDRKGVLDAIEAKRTELGGSK